MTPTPSSGRGRGPNAVSSRSSRPKWCTMPSGRELAAPDPDAADAGLMQGQAGQADEQQIGYREPRVGGGTGGIDNPGDGEDDRRDDGKHAHSASHITPG